MAFAILVNQSELALRLKDNGSEYRVLGVDAIHGQVALPGDRVDKISQEGDQSCASTRASRLIEHGCAQQDRLPVRVVQDVGPRDRTLGKVLVERSLGSTYVLVEDVGLTARSELLVAQIATLTVPLGECNLGVRAAHPRVDAFHDEFSW